MRPGPALNIAMVAACPFPTSQGSQVLIRELSESLVRRGHRVHVVTYHFGEEQVCRGVKIHRIPQIFPYRKFRSGPEIRKPILDLLLARKLDQVVCEEKIQIIHAHNYEAPLAAIPARVLRKIPLVYHSHNTMSDEFYTYFRLKFPQFLARFAAHIMDRTIPRQADFIIAINRKVADFLIQKGIPASRIKFIPPGIDFGDLPRPNPDLRRILNLGDGPLILYVGNLDGYQRLDLLMRALRITFASHPSAKFVLLTGSDVRPFRKAVLEFGLDDRMVILERLPFQQVKEICALGSIAVNTRISWSGFPIKLLNYMVAGLPVVAFSGSAAPIEHGVTGLLVPPQDVEAFAAAMLKLLFDQDLCSRMGVEARKIVRRDYSWDEITSLIEAHYYHLLEISPVVIQSVAEEKFSEAIEIS
jgi:glycosyltransferase involved in cell wall biosynthesis